MQLQIMQLLWQRGPTAARDITRELSPKGDIAHSTVQTVLRKMEAKGVVRHTIDDRTFIYEAAAKPDRVRRTATRDFLGRLFGGSPAGLISYLIQNEKLSADELHELRALIDEKEK